MQGLILLFFWLFFPKTTSLTTITFPNGQVFTVEVARTEKEITQGLSGRKTLADNAGMLFIFPQKSIYAFWMKEMNFPLDFVWLDNEMVVDLTKNVLPPDKNNQNNLPIYRPKQPINRVLEINAGLIDKTGLKIGDFIE